MSVPPTRKVNESKQQFPGGQNQPPPQGRRASAQAAAAAKARLEELDKPGVKPSKIADAVIDYLQKELNRQQEERDLAAAQSIRDSAAAIRAQEAAKKEAAEIAARRTSNGRHGFDLDTIGVDPQ